MAKQRTNIEIVQAIFKVLGVLAKVFFVLSIVVLALSVAGTAIVCVVLSLGNASLETTLANAGYTPSSFIGMMIVAIVASIIGVIVTKIARDYYMMELQAGTPFTHEGASAFRALGLVQMIAPVVAVILIHIIAAITGCCSDVGSSDSYFVTGIVMILISYVFDYGADVLGNKGPVTAQLD